MLPTRPQLICLIGAECTGKTTLAQHLARTFTGLWVPERLRMFCDAHGRTPLQGEQTGILEQQTLDEHASLEDAQRNGMRFVFCDTAPLLTAIYSECIFGDLALYAKARQLHARYAYTLVLQPDLPWITDGLQRDGAHVQTPVHTRIVQELQGLKLPFHTVGGTGDTRFTAAQNALRAYGIV